MNIVWEDDYKIGVETIDNQHKEFVEILAELLQACETAEVEEKTGEILVRLTQYADAHFAFEEGKMEDFDFPDRERHAAEHQLFRDRIEQLKEKYESGDHILQFEVFDLMQSWLKDHVLGEDKKFVECFREHGMK